MVCWSGELALIRLFMVLCSLAIFLLTQGEGGLASDFVKFYLPQINEFREGPFSLFNYQATATTFPIYRFLMGGLARLFSVAEVTNDNLGSRCVLFLLSVSSLVVFVHFLSKTCDKVNDGHFELTVDHILVGDLRSHLFWNRWSRFQPCLDISDVCNCVFRRE